VIGLREIDFRKIGGGQTGPVTRRFQALYHEATRGEHSRSRSWLTFVRPSASRTAAASQ
jgi:hypothetical protein